MKKILVLITLTTLTHQGFSQVTIKPAAGLNFTDFSKDGGPGGKAQAKVGWQLGGSVAFGRKFYWEPGIFYVGKSTEFTSTLTSTNDIKTSFNGIRIPLNVGYQIIGNESSAATLRIFGGISGFFITSADNINKDSLNTSIFALLAGAGVDIWKLFVDFSYEWSMTNIQNDINAIDLGKTRTVFLNAGIRINL
jgi:hypothetical protein